MKTISSRLAAAALAIGGSTGALAQGYTLEGAVIDSRDSRNLGVVSERGDIAGLFRAQKAVTFGILRSAGISLDQLTPEVRARIERFQTNNIEAFRAFSQGLDLKDQGKFAEAKEAFRRAAELDPGFALAAEQQRAMPDINLGAGLQNRVAAVVAAAGAAVDRGKATYAVDATRAAAALAAGQTVVMQAATVPSSPTTAVDVYTSNQPGSGSQLALHQAVGLAYTRALDSATSVASVQEWATGKVKLNATGDTLESVGSTSGSDFLAERQTAAVINSGGARLIDGSIAYWGSWNSTTGSTATIKIGGTSYPLQNNTDFVYGPATAVMPATAPGGDTVAYTPRGGSFGSDTTGTIAVNLNSRHLELQNLGFTLGTFSFSGLTGSADYNPGSSSFGTNNHYTGGSCTGCVGFTPANNTFGGNFIGSNAGGLIFSTIMKPTPTGTVAGVQLFTRGP